jgi:hypothetical protein
LERSVNLGYRQTKERGASKEEGEGKGFQEEEVQEEDLRSMDVERRGAPRPSSIETEIEGSSSDEER